MCNGRSDVERPSSDRLRLEALLEHIVIGRKRKTAKNGFYSFPLPRVPRCYTYLGRIRFVHSPSARPFASCGWLLLRNSLEYFGKDSVYYTL